MKKILSFIIVATMLVAMLIPFASAASTEDIGFVQVLYAAGNTITVDGILNVGEWDETNKLTLGEHNMDTWTNDFMGCSSIDFYYSWGDNGLYIAARVYDPVLKFTAYSADDNTFDPALQDRFQIAFNPGAMIAPEFSGLFFSFVPSYPTGAAEDAQLPQSGDLITIAHNVTEAAVDAAVCINTDDFCEGKYVRTENGWDMEAVIPWKRIASETREWDIFDNISNEPFLMQFDPKSEDRSLAFCTATICYVDMGYTVMEDGTERELTKTARTCVGTDAGNFNVDSFDCILKFNLADQTPDTVTGKFEAPETLPPEDTEPIGTDAPGGEVGSTSTEASGTNAATGTGVWTSATGEDPADDDGFPWIWVIVGAVGAAVIVVVIIVVLKKKK